MNDLRRRFASLDRMDAPDLWDTIAQRAAGLESVARVTAVATPVPLRSRTSSRRSLALLAATVALLVGLVAGALSVGSRPPALPAIVPVTSATHSAPPSLGASTTPAPSDPASDRPAPWIVFLGHGRSDRISRIPWWAMRADGSGAHQITTVSNPGPIAWSRDGTRLLMLANSDRPGIVVADVGEDIGPFVETGIEVPVNDQWEAFDFAPDGERVVDVRRSKCRTRPSGGTSTSSGVVLAMYVDTPGANCYVLSILDLRTRELTDLDETLVKDQTGKQNLALELPAWSPDGTRIAYTRLDETLDTRELWVVNADGTNPSRIKLTADLSVRGPRWSPDGTRISFTSETPSESAVYVADLATGRTEHVTIDSDPAASQLCCAEWLDSTRLRVAASERTDPDRFWEVALDASPPGSRLLVDLTESLAAIDPPRTAIGRSAPGDPGRTFYWQPVPEPR